MPDEVVHVIEVITLPGLGELRMRQSTCWVPSGINFGDGPDQ